ncbi:MAG: S8 family serine peptidase [Anaerolineae bacterium]
MFQPSYPRTGATPGIVPTPLRVSAASEWTGRGIGIAVIDSGFYPHPDFSRRVRVHVNAAYPTLIESRQYRPALPASWHGTMVTAIAAGSGRRSGGRYAGMAPAASLALVSVLNPRGGLREADILRGLRWVRDHGPRFGVRVVNLSVGGDKPSADPNHPIHELIRELDARGVIVVAAAGNGGRPCLVPPASAPEAITVGGVDDHNQVDPDGWSLFHHDWSQGKPDVLAPAAWIASPLLPGTPQARAARRLNDLLAVGVGEEARASDVLRKGRRDLGLAHVVLDDQMRAAVQDKLVAGKVIDAEYQYVDGTSVAAAIVSGVVAQVLQANPALTPRLVREILVSTARRLPHAPPEKQGAGMVDAGAAVADALQRKGKGGR